MEDRQSRLFLALILSMGIWMGVNYFFFPNTSTKKIPKQNRLNPIKRPKIRNNKSLLEKQKNPIQSILLFRKKNNSFRYEKKFCRNRFLYSRIFIVRRKNFQILHERFYGS
ncbi:hypothetical protein LEP1GSC127_2054 [Leptospira kirschneri str. 200801925]|nr:hypothetical protein LEP1GSC127_2054 [Leptospira kirschneri str. 200801925]